MPLHLRIMQRQIISLICWRTRKITHLRQTTMSKCSAVQEIAFWKFYFTWKYKSILSRTFKTLIFVFCYLQKKLFLKILYTFYHGDQANGRPPSPGDPLGQARDKMQTTDMNHKSEAESGSFFNIAVPFSLALLRQSLRNAGNRAWGFGTGSYAGCRFNWYASPGGITAALIRRTYGDLPDGFTERAHASSLISTGHKTETILRTWDDYTHATSDFPIKHRIGSAPHR